MDFATKMEPGRKWCACFRAKMGPNWLLEASWGPGLLAGVLASWGRLDRSWGFSGGSWGRLGAHWAALGGLLGVTPVGTLGALSASPEGLLGASGRRRGMPHREDARNLLKTHCFR